MASEEEALDHELDSFLAENAVSQPVSGSKARLGIVYSVVGAIRIAYLAHLASRTTFWTLALFAPLDFIILGAVSRAVLWRTNRSFCLNIKNALAIAVTAAVIHAATLFVAGQLNTDTLSGVQLFVLPISFIVIHSLFKVNSEEPSLTLLLIPVGAALSLFGSAASIPTFLSAFSVILLVTFQAVNWAYIKRWYTVSIESHPLELIANYAPLTAILLLPLTITALVQHKSILISPKQSLPKILIHIAFHSAETYTLVSALQQFDSSQSIANLTLLKGLFVCLTSWITTEPAWDFTLVIVYILGALLLAWNDDQIWYRLPLARKYQNEPARRFIPWIPLSFLLVFLLRSSSSTLWPVVSSKIPHTSLPSLQRFAFSPPRTIDVVIAYYNEPIPETKQHIEWLRAAPYIHKHHTRVIVYAKHPETVPAVLKRQLGADAVYQLDNKGREGGTYLQHIMRIYNASLPDQEGRIPTFSSDSLADMTLFMQPHFAWHWIGQPRLLNMLHDRTGYLHFAPYLQSDCGEDKLGNGNFPTMMQIYASFRETFCPPTLQLASYAAQFAVSKKRILANSWHKYKALDDLLEAPEDHWIYQEGKWWKFHGEPGPTNPYLGHAVERSWPVIFGCEDPEIATKCPDDKVDAQYINDCQCLD